MNAALREGMWGKARSEIIDLIKECPGEWTTEDRARAKKNKVSDNEIDAIERRALGRWVAGHDLIIRQAINKGDYEFFREIADALAHKQFKRDAVVMLTGCFLAEFPAGSLAEFKRWIKARWGDLSDDKTLAKKFREVVKGKSK